MHFSGSSKPLSRRGLRESIVSGSCSVCQCWNDENRTSNDENEDENSTSDLKTKAVRDKFQQSTKSGSRSLTAAADSEVFINDDDSVLRPSKGQDLNPIGAGIALTPETSDFTSVQERIVDRQSAMTQAVSTGLSATFSPAAGEKGQGGDAMDLRVEHGEHAGWLAPVDLDPPRKQVREKQPDRRASNKGFLPMTLDQYLKLLDWTGRQLRKDKAGKIPAEFEAILERLDCSVESWLDLVQNFRKRFRTEAGLAKSLQSVSSARRSRRHANSSA